MIAHPLGMLKANRIPTRCRPRRQKGPLTKELWLPRRIRVTAACIILRTTDRESGGIGRRTRLRIWRGNPWGFESPLSHQSLFAIVCG
jgi:hypothetical protein